MGSNSLTPCKHHHHCGGLEVPKASLHIAEVVRARGVLSAMTYFSRLVASVCVRFSFGVRPFASVLIFGCVRKRPFKRTLMPCMHGTQSSVNSAA